MDIEDMKNIAQDETTYRTAVLAMLGDIDNSLDRLKYLTELNIAANTAVLSRHLDDNDKAVSEVSWMRGKIFD